MIPKSGYRFSEKIMLQELRLKVEGQTDAEGVERFLQIDAHAARRRTGAAGGMVSFSRPVATIVPSLRSMYAVTSKFVGNVGLDEFRRSDVAVTTSGVAGSHLGYSAPVQRRRVLRIDPQRRIVVGDRVFRLAQLQVDKATAIERVQVAGTELQRCVAIPQGRLQLADHGARPAAIVQTLDIFWVEPNNFVEILDCTRKIAVLRIELPALVISGSITSIERDFLIKLLDCRVVHRSGWIGSGSQSRKFLTRQLGVATGRILLNEILPGFLRSRALRRLVGEPHGGIRIGPRSGKVFLRLDRRRGGVGRRPPGGRERKVLDQRRGEPGDLLSLCGPRYPDHRTVERLLDLPGSANRLA